MIYDFNKLRPSPKYPIYPSYHIGLYLEDYFFEFYLRNKDKFDAKGRIFLPISWTSLYVDNDPVNIQEYLDVLDPKDAYFAVSQHDEGIRQRLPPNTLHFAAGGLGGGIPIPLICSPIPHNSLLQTEKNILCSFVGSNTHPIRNKLIERYKSVEGFHMTSGVWLQNVATDKVTNFINTTQQSVFSLCPRGFGLTSFRLYEVLQLNSIPVYVSDKHWLPFTHKINWNEFCVIVKEDEIVDLEDILKDISEIDRLKMLTKGKEIYDDFFTLEKTCQTILDML